MKKVLIACIAALACGSVFAQSDIEATDRGAINTMVRMGPKLNGPPHP